ncbi:MAG: DHH family phosphoesterase [Euryarchaeota archaeon]|nr:DHH family phosphoesterase [Euryarchaeota archaeon]
MDSLEQRLQRARELIERGDYFRILTHYDVDGVCSAGIVAGYLRELGKKFHVSFFRNSNKDTLWDAINEGKYVILTDMGSGFVQELQGNIIVLDHHTPVGDNEEIVHVNPRLFGIDGSREACATTMAYMLANDKKYVKCLAAGLLGDKQYVPGAGPVGLNKKLLEEAGVNPVINLTLHGNVADAVFYSVEPFYPGLSGRMDRVKKVLAELGIDSGKDVEELTEEEKYRLGSYLAYVLVRQSEIPDAGMRIVDVDFNIDGSVRRFTDLIDAACRTDNQSVALGYVLGVHEYRDRMEVMLRDYRGEVIEGLYEVLKNLFTLDHVQYFYAKSSYLGSTLATISSMYLLNPNRVTLSFYVGDKVSISARAHSPLAEKVNLGEIMRKVSRELGGDGGGHDVAAGATIPVGKEKEFVKRVNEEVEKSLSS